MFIVYWVYEKVDQLLEFLDRTIGPLVRPPAKPTQPTRVEE